MIALRRLALAHRGLAACLVLAALWLKLLVPAGVMPTMAHGTISIAICSGTGPAMQAIDLAAMAGMPEHHGPADPERGHDKAPMPCAFAGLGLPSLAAADPEVLALALAFVLAIGFARVATRPTVARVWLRPPLRGPPATG